MVAPDSLDDTLPPARPRRLPLTRRRVLALVGMTVGIVGYAILYHRLDTYVVPDEIAASPGLEAPETKWDVAREPLPAEAAGLYYVPGEGILPVARDARWADAVPGVVAVLFDDPLNTWQASASLVDLPGLPAFLHVDERRQEPVTKVVSGAGLRDPTGAWRTKHGGHEDGLPPAADRIEVDNPAGYFKAIPRRTIALRSPAWNNAVRAERVALADDREGVTVAIAAVAAWPGGIAIRLEGWTDDPNDVVLLGLDFLPEWMQADQSERILSDPNAPVVLRDDRGRRLTLRNVDRLTARRDVSGWADWLGHGAMDMKPGVDLPATLVFDAPADDATGLALTIGRVRVAHDILLPETADRPSEGEERTVLTVSVPVRRSVARGSQINLTSVPMHLTVGGAPLTVQQTVLEGSELRIHLGNEAQSASRRLVDVLVSPHNWNGRRGQRFRSHGTGYIAFDAGWTPTVAVRAGPPPRWLNGVATAAALVRGTPSPGAASTSSGLTWPVEVALVRPIVELAGRWTFDVPLDVLRANAAANAGVGPEGP